MNIFVPARQGSTRVYHKNARLINGLPLIEWTFVAIERLKQLRSHERFDVFVSSDDPFVQDLAQRYHFISLLRPSSLATTSAKMSDVLFHHVSDMPMEDTAVLYPTSPLRNEQHINAALDLWLSKGGPTRSLMSVSSVTHRPYGLMNIDAAFELKLLHPDGKTYYQAQNMPISYRANGAIFILPYVLLAQQEIDSQLFSSHTIPYVMNEYDALEVDNEDDIPMIEALMKKKNQSVEISEASLEVGLNGKSMSVTKGEEN